MRKYFQIVDCALEKYHVPTKAIQAQVRELANQQQIILSHIENLTASGKVQKSHVSEIRAAMRASVKIMQKIQQLAAIEIEKGGE